MFRDVGPGEGSRRRSERGEGGKEGCRLVLTSPEQPPFGAHSGCVTCLGADGSGSGVVEDRKDVSCVGTDGVTREKYPNTDSSTRTLC